MRSTKSLVLIVAAVIIASSISALAARAETPQQFAKRIAKAYETKRLATLDAEKPYAGTFRVTIEHSLADDTDKGRFVTRSFSSLKKAEQWIKNRMSSEGTRESRQLKRCSAGTCTYDFDGGILHNHLYLKKITYGTRGGKLYIKSIYLLDGD